MSRIAKKPIAVPKGVEVKQQGNVLHIKSSKGEFKHQIHDSVTVAINDDATTIQVMLKPDCARADKPMLGTTSVILSNFVVGLDKGFERKLLLVGVGYRAKVKANVLELNLGFSHPVAYKIPAGVNIETLSNTEILVKGISKELIGQVAAEIRAFRPPEPYKGKGVRYADEVLIKKETKKK